MRIPDFSQYPAFLKKYENKYLKYVKVMRFLAFTNQKTTLRLKDDPHSTNYKESTEFRTANVFEFQSINMYQRALKSDSYT